jgi:hypothetical protein
VSRNTLLLCDAAGDPNEILVYEDEAITAGPALVRSTHHNREAYGIQYSQTNLARGSGCIIADMYEGGNNPNHPGLGHAAVFHCNNTCNTGGALFRNMFVGGRIANGFTVKSTTIRANQDMPRSMFIAFTQLLAGEGYHLPPCLAGMLCIPVEHPYGPHVNSRVPRPIRPPHVMTVEEQRCKCLTLLWMSMLQHGYPYQFIIIPITTHTNYSYTHTYSFVCFDNVMPNPQLVAITNELIDRQDNMSATEKAKVKGWLILQRRIEASAPPRWIPQSPPSPIPPAPEPEYPSPILHHLAPAARPTPSLLLAGGAGAAADFTSPELRQIQSLAAVVPRRLSFQEPEYDDDIDDMDLPLYSSRAAISSVAAGGSWAADVNDDDIRIDLSNMSIEEGAPPSLPHEDDYDDDDAVLVVGTSIATPSSIHNSGRRPRVSFTDSPPVIIGTSVADGSTTADAIMLVDTSPPHKRNKPEGG